MYTFIVNKASTKTEIRAAVEELWSVRVVSVNEKQKKRIS